MPARIATNVAALAVHRQLARADSAGGRSLERLSSGLRINRAADDAAGLAIAEGLRSRIGGMRQAVRNTLDGISLLQTAEGALTETTAVLQRMRDLSVQAANDGGLSAGGRAAVQAEVRQLQDELTRIATTTSFNGSRLLDGSYDRAFQVGAEVGETLRVAIGAPGLGLDAEGLGVADLDVTRDGAALTTTVTPAVSDAQGTPAAGRMTIAGDFITPGLYQAAFTGLTGIFGYDGQTFDFSTVDYTGATTVQDHLSRLDTAAVAALGTSFIPFTATATGLLFAGETPAVGSTAADAVALTPTYQGTTGVSGAIPLIDAAIGRVSTVRAELGAVQNRMEHTVARLGVAVENATASESRIRDTDMAAEMTVFARNQVVSQAATAMLAQATQVPQAVLKLLG